MEQKKKNGFDFSEMSRQKDLADADKEIRKSSYLISAGLQKKLKVFAAERGVKMNDLISEALTDLLRKYGRI